MSALDRARQLEAIQERIQDALLTCDPDGRIVEINPAAEVLLGSRSRQYLGEHFDVIFPKDRARDYRSAIEGRLAGAPTSGSPLQVVVLAGNENRTEVTVTAVRHRGGDGWWGTLVLRDESQHLAFTRLLEHEATHDRLTGLPNRAFLRELLDQALARAAARKSYVGVLFVGLDEFRSINDARGHEAGDAILSETARRIRRIVPPAYSVVRAGGDEFVVVCETEGGVEAILDLAQGVARAIRRPFRTSSGAAYLTASVGVSSVSHGRGTAAGLVRQADTALHRAKDHGAGRVESFEPDMRTRVEARHDLEVALREAELATELTLHYQPLLRLSDNSWSGFEALLRWRTASGEYIPPSAFVPALERSGQIRVVGAWALERACRQLVAWNEARPDAPLHVAVNLSVRQLESPDVVPMVRDVMQRTGIDPKCLVLEVTESVLSLDLSGLAGCLSALRDLGVTISIDDFGTGYSSLAYLHQLPADILKVDRSFVAQLGQPGADIAIVQTITALARTLGMKVVAEGVEEPRQLELLRDLGVDYAQGYLFSRAVAAADVPALLEAGPGAVVSS